MTTLRKENGFTLIELLIVVAVIGIIAAIAVPGLLRARVSGNEASAIGSLRSINSAQLSYNLNCADGTGYAPSLANLATPPTAGGQAFISPDLASADGVPVVKSGFTITSTGANVVATASGSCNGAAPGSVVANYLVSADPIAWSTSGTRHFGTSEGQTLFQEMTDTTISAISTAGVPTPSSATPFK